MLELGAWLVLAAQAGTPTLPEHAEARLVPLRFLHDSLVTQAVLPGDRSRLYTLEADGFLNAWESGSGRQLYRTQIHGTCTLRASTNGKILALEAADRKPSKVTLIEAATGRALRQFAGIRKVALSGDGSVLAGLEDKYVRRWRVDSGAELPTCEALNELLSVCLSSDGRRVAAGSRYGWIMWDGESGKRVAWSSPLIEWGAACISFSSDDRSLAAGDLWGTRVMEVGEGTLTPVKSLQAVASEELVFTKDGSGLISLHRHRLAAVWDLRLGEARREWRAHGDVENERLFVSSDGEVVLRARTHGLLLHRVSDDPGKEAVTAAIFLDAGRALTASDGRVRTWDLRARRVEQEQSVPPLTVQEFSKDGRRARLSDGETVVIWDLPNDKEMFRHKEGDFAVSALSSDGRRVAVYANRVTRIWDLEKGGEPSAGRTPEPRVTALKFSADARLLAKGVAGGELTLVLAATGQEAASFAPRSNAHFVVIAFSPDGKSIATGDAKGIVRLWKIGTEPEQVRACDLGINVLAFSPDGSRLAGGARREGVFLTSIVSPFKELASFQWTLAPPSALAFSDDGRRLLTGSLEGGLYLWRVLETK